LYHDDQATVRYSNWTYVIYSQSSTASYTGNYSIVFYDVFGEDWSTDPIDISATCTEVTNALEALPNNVIAPGTVQCLELSSYPYTLSESYGTIYNSAVNIKKRFTLAFPDNAGVLKQIQINTHLDGARPTLFTSEVTSTLGVYVYANGFTGEFYDYVSDYCENVLVTIQTNGQTGTGRYEYLQTTDSLLMPKLLKICLGSADGDTTQASLANEVYNWDYGTKFNPHLVKLVDSTALPISYLCSSLDSYSTEDNSGETSFSGLGTCFRSNPPGFYVAVIYTNSQFKLLNPSKDYSTSTTFYVFTTKGYLQLVSNDVTAYSVVSSQSASQIASLQHSNTLYLNTTGSPKGVTVGYVGQIDCEFNPAGTNNVSVCLKKDDYVFVLNPDYSYDSNGYTLNPRYLNLYQVKKLWREQAKPGLSSPFLYNSPTVFENKLVLNYGVNKLYSLGTITAGSTSPAIGGKVYKFFPPTGVEYATECSARGICNQKTGECECFSGHTGDDCSVQNALAQ